MCTGTNFSMHSEDAKSARRFLWWHWDAVPASITLRCLNCDFKWPGHVPGSVTRDSDIMHGLRVLAQ